MSHIILFDGDCHFCNQSVQFIIKRDKKGRYTFASLQSEVGQTLLTTYGVPKETDSLVLIKNNRYYLESSAVLHICRHLTGLWKLLTICLVIPPAMRNSIYRVMAKNRYRWFGKRNSCQLFTEEMRERFLDL